MKNQVHDHDDDHDDKDDDDDVAEGDDQGKDSKANRGEKKLKKALTKMGMQPVKGINRVTIKKNKSLLLYIENPEVLKSPSTEGSYIVFGKY